MKSPYISGLLHSVLSTPKKLTFQLKLLLWCYTVSNLIGKIIVVYFQTLEKQKRTYYETAMMHGMQMNKILKITFTDKLVT